MDSLIVVWWGVLIGRMFEVLVAGAWSERFVIWFVKRVMSTYTSTFQTSIKHVYHIYPIILSTYFHIKVYNRFRCLFFLRRLNVRLTKYFDALVTINFTLMIYLFFGQTFYSSDYFCIVIFRLKHLLIERNKIQWKKSIFDYI